jgi:DNA-binding NarL/FixJ family response regulator
MAAKRVIALFGDSLLIDTVEASLQNSHNLGVVRVQTASADALDRLESLSPDLIIFDLNDPNSHLVIPFFRDHQSTPLLCLDVTCSKVLALSCQHHTATSALDLQRLIYQETAHHAPA